MVLIIPNNLFVADNRVHFFLISLSHMLFSGEICVFVVVKVFFIVELVVHLCQGSSSIFNSIRNPLADFQIQIVVLVFLCLIVLRLRLDLLLHILLGSLIVFLVLRFYVNILWQRDLGNFLDFQRVLSLLPIGCNSVGWINFQV